MVLPLCPVHHSRPYPRSPAWRNENFYRALREQSHQPRGESILIAWKTIWCSHIGCQGGKNKEICGYLSHDKIGTNRIAIEAPAVSPYRRMDVFQNSRV